MIGRICVDEWVAEIERLQQQQAIHPPGFTITDIVDATGINRDRILRIVHSLIKADKVKFVGHSKRPGIDQRPYPVPTYTLTSLDKPSRRTRPKKPGKKPSSSRGSSSS